MSTAFQKLEEARQLEAKASEAVFKLLSTTKQSVSFGDQSYTNADIEKLMRVRDQLRSEVRALEAQVEGRKNTKTIKVRFPAC